MFDGRSVIEIRLHVRPNAAARPTTLFSGSPHANDRSPAVPPPHAGRPSGFCADCVRIVREGDRLRFTYDSSVIIDIYLLREMF